MPAKANPERLAQLAHRRIKAPPEALCEALRGRVTRHLPDEQTQEMRPNWPFNRANSLLYARHTGALRRGFEVVGS